MNESNDATSPLPAEALYPIRTVSAVTGVNAVTLRAWERRYNLLKPSRTPKGHRLYTRDQIELVRRIVELLDQGLAISQVKPLLDRKSPAESGSPAPRPSAGDAWQPYIARLLEAIGSFDAPALDRLYGETMSLYPVDTVTERLTIPTLEKLGARWRTEQTGIAEEHFFNAYLRNKLGARFHHLSERSTGPRLVAACAPGEQHETGLLLFCLSAVEHGFRLVYLGANMPLQELPAVVTRSGAAAVVLSVASRPKPGLFTEQIPDLVQQLSVPLFVGGYAAAGHESQVTAASAVCVGNDIPSAVRRIAETLAA